MVGSRCSLFCFRSLWKIQRLDVERKTADLVGEHREGGWCTSVTNRFALHYCIEGGRTTLNIVGLNREHFAKRICGAIAKKCPHFHFAEALTTVLCLTTKWLLSDERVRTDRTHMNLIFHHVMEFEYIHIADRNLLCKGIPRTTVIQLQFTALIEACSNKFSAN